MYERRPYEICPLEGCTITAEELVSGSRNDEIISRIREIIRVESPIQRPLLLKRLINSISLQKVGSQMEAYFDSLLPTLSLKETTEAGIPVYWEEGKTLDYFRYSGPELRYSYQIPVSEAVLVILEILSTKEKTATKKVLLEEFASQLGYLKKGSQVVALFEAALDAAVASGRALQTANYRYRIGQI